MRTFDRVYGRGQHQQQTSLRTGTYTLTQILSYLAQADGRICSDTGLFVIGSACQELEQVAIDRAVREFSDDCQHSLDGLLSDHGCNIRKSGCLYASAEGFVMVI
jgi:hypothetical protein